MGGVESRAMLARMRGKQSSETGSEAAVIASFLAEKGDAGLRAGLDAIDFQRLREACQIGTLELEEVLLELAGRRARAPVSGFRVGAILRTLEGGYWMGANLEFEGAPLAFTVHAEIAAFHQGHLRGSRGFDRLSINASPCGHCRQFLSEHDHRSAVVVVGGSEHRLADLLPDAFGRMDLPAGRPVVVSPSVVARSDAAIQLAKSACAISLAPWSREPAGVAVVNDIGRMGRGAYLESAAFNPSLPAISAALSDLELSGGIGTVERVVLAIVEGSSLHIDATRLLAERLPGRPAVETVVVSSI